MQQQRIIAAVRVRGLAMSCLLFCIPLTGCATNSTAIPEAPAERRLPPPFAFAEKSTPAGGQLAWVLNNLNEKRGRVLVPDVRQHFADAALRSASAEQLGLMFYTLSRDLGPLTMSRVVTYPKHPELLVALGKSRDQENIKILLSVEPKTGRINNLLFQNADNPNRATSYQQIDEALRIVAPSSQILVAEITDNGCEPLHDMNPGEAFPIGKARQLFLFQELVTAVVEGGIAWGEVLPPGRESVDQLATRMIAQGAEDAEEILRQKLDAKDRREQESAIVLCKLMANLANEANRFSLAAPALDILAATPSDGVSINRRTFSYVGSKRNLAADAVTLTWLLQRHDRRMFFVTLSAKGVANRLDDAIFEIATVLVQLVGASP